ncbi:MAG: nodulation protein NfeD [Nitrospirae bacterium]|nr:nodulation protein NfeD [Nitrospirota bacterium]
MKTFRLILFVVLIAVSAALAVAKDSGVRVDAVKVDGVINPVTAEFLDKAVNQAAVDKAEALVILLDTPGGLDTSMRLMVKTITGSPIPIITYVSPSGARAASAGVFIMMASPVAAMSPGTNIGAAHPVSVGGEKVEAEMARKVENDAAAYIRSLAQKNGRNADWAEKAVRESVSISETDALNKNVIDIVAPNLDDLLAKVDGRKVVTSMGERTLHTKGAAVVWHEMGARLRLLKAISDPNVAYVLMMIGMLGLFFELSNPGLILPGVLGGISLILAFYSFQTLPVNYAGMMLILLAVVFLIAEVKVTSYGLLAVAGVISLVLGSVMLIDSPLPYMRISLSLILPAAATITAFFMILVRAAVRARGARVSTGAEGMVGAYGDARTDIEPGGSGDVYVMGSHWSAYSDTPVRKGERVVVTAIEGLKLKVTRKS